MKPLSIIDEIGLAPYTDDPARIAILADWCEDSGHWAAWYYRARRDMVYSRYVSVSAGGIHSLALRRDGTIAAWGSNWSGQCDIPAGRYIAISAGDWHSLALREDGTISAWGSNWSGQCNAPAGRYVAIGAGSRHSLALREDGAVVAWGQETDGLCCPPPSRSIRRDQCWRPALSLAPRRRCGRSTGQ
jgi:alpha-tubulin suppressor-like RCC1 family protein